MYSTVGAREASGPSVSDDSWSFYLMLPSHPPTSVSPHTMMMVLTHNALWKPWQRPQLDKYQRSKYSNSKIRERGSREEVTTDRKIMAVLQRPDHLRAHLITHSGEKSNICKQCGSAFGSVGGLRLHLKTHSGNKPNKCNLCNFASSRAGHLTTHLKRHSGEKPNKCNQCNFASVEVGDLRKHMITHSSGEKLNKCN